jgi:putative ABC transport system permease protein
VVREILAAKGISAYSTGHLYRVDQILAPGIADRQWSPTLMGRTNPGASILHGAAWGSRPDGVYAYPYSQVPIGSTLEITGLNGEPHKLEVVGSFENGEQAAWPGLNDQLLVPEELGQQLGTPSNSQFFLAIQPARLSATLSELGKALPQTTLLSMPEYQARYVRQYQNLFAFVAVMAGLAILAGILLVANSVSLAMLDRRFEIGVLKSIGYSRGQVLFSQVVEYTLMSVVVTLTGLGLIWGLLGLAGLANDVLASMLVLRPETAAVIALVSVGFTALTVLWATWKPSNASPVFVLNDRE